MKLKKLEITKKRLWSLISEKKLSIHKIKNESNIANSKEIANKFSHVYVNITHVLQKANRRTPLTGNPIKKN